jgi:co-chaperonin GroES (HSP10)
VLVKPLNSKDKFGSIYVPDTAKENHNRRIVAIGTGSVTNDGKESQLA